NTAFAFPDRDMVWQAMDGGVGEYLGGLIERVGIHAHGKLWDNGYRQCTTSTRPIEKAGDFAGLKFRVAPAPMLVSVFKSLGAAPVTINIAETYSALQTRVVDGQENGLALIETLKLNEVQKYCSL